MNGDQDVEPLHTMPDRAAHDLVELALGELRLVLAPRVGGSIAEFSSRRGGVVQHWLRPASEAALRAVNPLGMASFPLLPWCNRIRDGRSDFGARPLRLAPNYGDSPHTIHGVGWQRPWCVREHGPAHAVLQLVHVPGELHGVAPDWPYRFEAEQRFTLDARGGLTVGMTLTNRDELPMPAGIGHHPYLPRRDGTRLQATVAAMWGGDAELLPTVLSRPPWLDELQRGMAVADTDLDNNFTGWSRSARIDWPDTGTALQLDADAPLDNFVIYSPPGFDHFCIEPVSNCTDWMNLAQHGEQRAGGCLLAPGETLRACFHLLPDWPA